MFRFSHRTEGSALTPKVRPYIGDLEHDLLEIKLPGVSVLDTLDIHKQTPEELASAIPGDALSIKTHDGHVEGRIYTLGESPILVAQRLIGAVNPDFTDEVIEKQALDVDRTIAADKLGQWYEHVYPIGKDVRQALENELLPLVEYANEADSFFVIAVVDSAYVIMPATMNKKVWNDGPSQRYGQYANLKDGFGELATQAMIYIDPGEKSGLTNSEQIGVMDKDIPPGQLQYDVCGDGIVVDQVTEDYKRGRKFKLFRSVGSFGIAGSDYGYNVTLEGQLEEQIFIDENCKDDAIAWNVQER